ncbi:ankyrin repeat domain-containing protein [Candidatus Sodalis sp. SoCistrobi]|uniref:ankyrin repeat domain-containing protein n=1 Tax=Candidatus Sodalis sp. SoCistrobi TaxID=1922216 RepID=UPI000F7A0AB5|nr:ankyrin repeat domain-containing protein [Candidatus Sodalis sp. SoCistrobi]
MPVSGVSYSLGHYPAVTMASSAYIVTDLKNTIYNGDKQGFIVALQNAIAAGINIDVEIDSDKNTPLSYALSQSQLSIAEYLLEIGADHTVTDDRGNTALMMLFHHYGENGDGGETTPDTFLALAEKLVDYEVDINRANKRNETAAMMALTSNKGDDVAMTLLTLMEPKGIELYLYDADGHSLMSKAITFTHGTEIVKKIIDMGFDVNDFSTLGHPHIEGQLGGKQSIVGNDSN